MEDRNALFVTSCALAGGTLAIWVLWERRRQRVAPAPRPTSFEPFLRSDVANPSASRAAQSQRAVAPVLPASFEAFLRAPSATAAAEEARANPTAAPPPGPPPDSCPVTVLFGTEFGFSKEVAEKACAAVAAGGGMWPELIDMGDHPAGLPLDRCQALLVVCSTQGDGVPPAEARGFCDWLAGASPPALPALHYSVAALGDKSYTHFARCGRRLDERLEALGASRLAPRVDVNKEDWTAIDSWIASVVAGLRALPLQTTAQLGWGLAAAASEGQGAGPATGAKRWSKSRPYYATVVGVEGLCTLRNPGDKNTVSVEIDLGESGLSYEPGDALGVWPTNAPEAVHELLVEIDTEGTVLVPTPGWHYAGDAADGGGHLAMMPLKEALGTAYDLRTPRRELLRLLHDRLPVHEAHGSPEASPRGLAAAAAAPHSLIANGHGADIRASARDPPGTPPSGTPLSAEAEVPLSKQNQRQEQSEGRARGIHVLSDAAAAIGSAGHQGPHHSGRAGLGAPGADCCTTFALTANAVAARRAELAALMADADATDRYLAPRHVIDVLRDFRGTAALPLLELLGALRPLAPRLYSISSSPLEHPRRVQVTVAAVRYSSLGVDRLGVCSTQLGERAGAGSTLPVYIARNPDFRLPPSPATPIIMVGPGTGLAPFRAFVQHRVLGGSVAGAPAGRAVLFFGCRRRDQDYLYGAQLERWAAEGHIKLFTAFSREQASKVYVQQRLREQAATVWELLEVGAHFYVCGDAASMAGEVEAALLEIIGHRQPGGGGPTAAREYLDGLAAAGRYQRDVWY